MLIIASPNQINLAHIDTRLNSDAKRYNQKKCLHSLKMVENYKERKDKGEHRKHGPDQVQAVPLLFVGLPEPADLQLSQFCNFQCIQSVIEGHVPKGGHAECAQHISDGRRQQQPESHAGIELLYRADGQGQRAAYKDQEEGRVEDGPVDGLHAFQVGEVHHLSGAGNYGYLPGVKEAGG